MKCFMQIVYSCASHNNNVYKESLPAQEYAMKFFTAHRHVLQQPAASRRHAIKEPKQMLTR